MGENYITCKEEKGSINISEDVLVSMVRAAAVSYTHLDVYKRQIITRFRVFSIRPPRK